MRSREEMEEIYRQIIPVINKIDLPSAQPDECKRQSH
jgi:translation elongation factor EF-4